ncbi:glutamine-hydrolyzing carbamoyl-phosphate synthase small subunit [Natroniella acetigena]|uniref:glutamine-hydrolyzing carbamoyl-phosphate synthase small subunit n=1 Tax=Natroniella acetigena TaxID=52004 RepID=UPI00200A4A3D|nr:glutamine-hydrolyzing carbamoyl-phosphate synthase small subunit [Natroniella acetigena]MCK8827473.1 glutamine-hydrolyzing carbamoyl-phosphate synthase small subunit [Natroniella acetigena]
MKKVILALEDGRYFEGQSFGATGEVTGEVVFNTSMTGYQEVLTDPSYKGQLVTMTYPLIGNYGVNGEDTESIEVQVSGFIVKEDCDMPSNWKSEGGSSQYLAQHHIIGIKGIDTRALTKHIRQEGMMQGIISTEESDPQILIAKAKASQFPSDVVEQVTTDKIYTLGSNSAQHNLVVVDLGVKGSILDSLVQLGCQITVVPATTSAEEIKRLNPTGVLLSNGPGDPKDIPEVVEMVRELIGALPLSGICLGHHVLGLALGGKTYKMKFGHHGGNQPVKDLSSGRIFITSQNHGYALEKDSLPSDVKVTHLNLNDGTVEGIKHQQLPIFSVQYHPEAAPGPEDSGFLFTKFLEMMLEKTA